MKALFDIDTRHAGNRTGTVEGLICTYPGIYEPGSLAIALEEFHHDSSLPMPKLIMLNTIDGGNLHDDVKSVSATKNLWAGIFTSDTRTVFGGSHYTTTIAELITDDPEFLTGRLVLGNALWKKHIMKTVFERRRKEQKLHLQLGRATVREDNKLCVESDLGGFSYRDRLLKHLGLF